jgi:hypothetical protein
LGHSNRGKQVQRSSDASGDQVTIGVHVPPKNGQIRVACAPYPNHVATVRRRLAGNRRRCT